MFARNARIACVHRLLTSGCGRMRAGYARRTTEQNSAQLSGNTVNKKVIQSKTKKGQRKRVLWTAKLKEKAT